MKQRRDCHLLLEHWHYSKDFKTSPGGAPERHVLLQQFPVWWHLGATVICRKVRSLANLARGNATLCPHGAACLPFSAVDAKQLYWWEGRKSSLPFPKSTPKDLQKLGAVPGEENYGSDSWLGWRRRWMQSCHPQKHHFWTHSWPNAVWAVLLCRVFPIYTEVSKVVAAEQLWVKGDHFCQGFLNSVLSNMESWIFVFPFFSIQFS